MYSRKRRGYVMALEMHLFDGMSQEEFYRHSRPTMPRARPDEKVIGYVELDLNTGRFTICENGHKRVWDPNKGNLESRTTSKEAHK